MTRRLRNHLPGFVTPFALAIGITASVAFAQNHANQPSGSPHFVSPTNGAANFSPAEPLRPAGTLNPLSPITRLPEEQYRTLDQNSPVITLTGFYDSGSLQATSLAAGDLNGDGYPDVVVTNQRNYQNPGTVGVLLSKGDGTFHPAAAYSSGAWNPWSIAIGDLNGDGKPDLAVANFNYGIGVLLGNGDGTFRAPVVYDPHTYMFSVAIGDINNDGRPDLVVAGWLQQGVNRGYIDVMLGNGDGTFQTPITYDSGGQYTYSVAIDDLNRDGHPDLIVGNNCEIESHCASGSVTVMLGNGDGTFQAPVDYFAGGPGTARIAIADLNGDGFSDVVVANYARCSNCSDSGVGVLLGNGDGTFQPAASYSAGGEKGFGIAVADIDGDGHLDLAVTNVNTNSIGVLLGNGDGTFQPVATFDSGGFADYSVAITDVNGDTLLDVLVANICGLYCPDDVGEGAVGVLLNNPSGTHISTTTALTSLPNPSVFGQAVTFTAQVNSKYGTPSGVVTFSDGSTKLGSAMLVNGLTSPSLSALKTGSHSITANYDGSLKFNPSTSSPITQVVNSASTTTSLSSSPNPVSTNKKVTYTATVKSQYGGALTGTVTFYDGGSAFASVALGFNQARYSTTYTAIGTHTITAAYSGDANNTGSTSPALTQYVAGASKTVVVTSGSPSYVGQSVTFTATVTSKYGKIPDAELVTFYDGRKVLSSVELAGGTAAYTTSSLSAKVHTIKATYVGDSSFLPSAGTVKQIVFKYSTITALTSDPNPSNYGQPVTFTATVTPSGPYAITGKVKFWDGTTSLGTAALNNGTAKLTKSTLSVGTHPITAQYLSDAYNDKSTSPVVDQVVQ